MKVVIERLEDQHSSLFYNIASLGKTFRHIFPACKGDALRQHCCRTGNVERRLAKVLQFVTERFFLDSSKEK